MEHKTEHKTELQELKQAIDNLYLLHVRLGEYLRIPVHAAACRKRGLPPITHVANLSTIPNPVLPAQTPARAPAPIQTAQQILQQEVAKVGEKRKASEFEIKRSLQDEYCMELRHDPQHVKNLWIWMAEKHPTECHMYMASPSLRNILQNQIKETLQSSGEYYNLRKAFELNDVNVDSEIRRILKHGPPPVVPLPTVNVMPFASYHQHMQMRLTPLPSVPIPTAPNPAPIPSAPNPKPAEILASIATASNMLDLTSEPEAPEVKPPESKKPKLAWLLAVGYLGVQIFRKQNLPDNGTFKVKYHIIGDRSFKFKKGAYSADRYSKKEMEFLQAMVRNYGSINRNKKAVLEDFAHAVGKDVIKVREKLTNMKNAQDNRKKKSAKSSNQ